MSIKMRRGIFAAFAAGAMAVTMTPAAFADLDDSDGSPPVIVPDETVSEAEVFRIADATRILTAIEASESRNDWGQIYSNTKLVWDCSVDAFWLDGWPVTHGFWEVGDYYYPIWETPHSDEEARVRCEVVEGPTKTWGKMDIIVSRSDDYPDALSAAPLADVLDAPILLNPTGALDADVKAEIERLAGIAGKGGRYPNVTVHLLGGTDALSHAVENAIDAIPNVDRTLRYQGIDRYETAVNIAEVTVDHYGLESGADGNDVNTYLTTGINFPDALAAGAAAANNDGVVLLTRGTELDRRGFTEQFLIDLEDWVNDDRWDINTTENFAVGGPSAQAVADYDIRVADTYVGVNRYETATLTAEAVFDLDPAGTDNFAVVSGEGFADALVASGYIANLDGPLLLTQPTMLNGFTAAYLEDVVEDGDRIFTFGGPDALRLAVTNEIKALLEAKFAVDPEIE